MPLSALEHVEIDYCVPALKMGALLYRLSQEPSAATPPIPEDLRIEVNIAENPTDNSDCAEKLGESASVMCTVILSPSRRLSTKAATRLVDLSLPWVSRAAIIGEPGGPTCATQTRGER
jgi:hypothetical protein